MTSIRYRRPQPPPPRQTAYDSMRSPFSSPRWLAAGVVLALLAGASALWLDLPLATWLRGHVSPGVDTAFAWIGYLGDSGKYIVVGLAFYIVGLLGAARGWPNPLRVRYESMTRGSLLLSTMAVGGLVVLLLKRGVARARPELYFEKGIYGMGEALARAVVQFLSVQPHLRGVFRGRGAGHPAALALGLSLAALVAVSRLVNLDHYLSDVMTAAGIAFAVAHWLSRACWAASTNGRCACRGGGGDAAERLTQPQPRAG